MRAPRPSDFGEAAIVAAVLLGLAGCSSRPRPSPGLIAIARNEKATVRGVVLDAATGRPVAGIEVYGLPEGKDFPWGPPATTDAEGRFTLEVAAPAKYAFLLRYRGISVVTPERDDPAYVEVETQPGGKIEGIELRFLREKFLSPP